MRAKDEDSSIAVLIVGDRFAENFGTISEELQSAASQPLTVHFCPDRHFALSRIHIYCDYELIVVSWSRYALLLALFVTQHPDYHPKIVLVSGIIKDSFNPSMDEILSYGLFDYFISSFDRSWSPDSWPQILRELFSVPAKPKAIEFEKTIGFYAYMWRNHVFKHYMTSHFLTFLHAHGETTDWTKHNATRLAAFNSFPTEFRREVTAMSHEIEVKPIWGAPGLKPGARRRCFVLMPFRSPFNEIYEDFIRPAVEESDLKCFRADDFYTTNVVMTDIWNALNNCLFVIAELTGRNPNVMYELGIAHTLGKEVILICQDSEDIPFDFKHMRYYRYDHTPRGCEKLRKDLCRAIAEIRAKA